MQLRSKWKVRMLSIVMILSMMVVGIQPTSVYAENADEDYYDDSDEDEDEIEDDETITSIDDMIDVSFNVTSQWTNHYNADVEITNISGEAIDDWELEFDFKDKIENILVGKVRKYYEEVCLEDQIYVKAENKETVSKFVQNNGGKIINMIRDEVGEGMEKKGENFAEEVAAQLNK